MAEYRLAGRELGRTVGVGGRTVDEFVLIILAISFFFFPFFAPLCFDFLFMSYIGGLGINRSFSCRYRLNSIIFDVGYFICYLNLIATSDSGEVSVLQRYPSLGGV